MWQCSTLEQLPGIPSCPCFWRGGGQSRHPGSHFKEHTSLWWGIKHKRMLQDMPSSRISSRMQRGFQENVHNTGWAEQPFPCTVRVIWCLKQQGSLIHTQWRHVLDCGEKSLWLHHGVSAQEAKLSSPYAPQVQVQIPNNRFEIPTPRAARHHTHLYCIAGKITTIRTDCSNSWVGHLFFRSPRQRLANNRNQAHDHLVSKQPQMKAHFLEFMENMLSRGHTEVAPLLQQGQECWYPPHVPLLYGKGGSQGRSLLPMV